MAATGRYTRRRSDLVQHERQDDDRERHEPERDEPARASAVAPPRPATCVTTTAASLASAGAVRSASRVSAPSSRHPGRRRAIVSAARARGPDRIRGTPCSRRPSASPSSAGMSEIARIGGTPRANSCRPSVDLGGDRQGRRRSSRSSTTASAVTRPVSRRSRSADFSNRRISSSDSRLEDDRDDHRAVRTRRQRSDSVRTQFGANVSSTSRPIVGRRQFGRVTATRLGVGVEVGPRRTPPRAGAGRRRRSSRRCRWKARGSGRTPGSPRRSPSRERVGAQPAVGRDAAGNADTGGPVLLVPRRTAGRAATRRRRAGSWRRGRPLRARTSGQDAGAPSVDVPEHRRLQAAVAEVERARRSGALRSACVIRVTGRSTARSLPVLRACDRSTGPPG